MIDNKQVHWAVLILLFLFVIIVIRYVIWGILLLALDNRLWGSETLGRIERPASELKDAELSFTVNKLVTGKHDLVIIFYESASLEQLEKPINFELTVQIRKGKITKEKKFTKIFTQGNSYGIFYLFDVPKDFLWSRNANIEITIKDINFDDEFTKYFEKLSFVIKHLQFIGHNINFVDGEFIHRRKGFKSW
jgi:hypothetical protein